DENLTTGMPAANGLKPELIAEDVLTAAGATPEEVKKFANRRPDTQWLELGQKLLVTKGCVNCHAVEPGGKAIAPAAKFPTLTGIGHKSRTSWLKSVLTGGGRARPWMQLRMPQYGEPNVGLLPEAFAFLEGTTPDDTVHKSALDSDKIAAGKTIIGKGGLGCI